MPHVASGNASSLKGAWRPTKVMNMGDLSRDDDFLSHLLVEKLGTGAVPLVVHKMDPSRRLPKTNADELLQIVRRMVAAKGPSQTAIRQAVDDLLSLPAVRYYLRSYERKQVNAFATHASRYFELYLPSGSIEIAHTSRYSYRTGKSELCILATRPLAPGAVISELKGSMADLTEEEDRELKRTDEHHSDGVGIRRDFSVIHSKQLKKNHLFLGPARFVNHDCDHNVELFREGRYITFRVIKPIAVGEEVTAHYGDGYFGRKNRHCLCETCEKNGRGGYAPQASEEEASDSGEDLRSHAGEGSSGSTDSSSSSSSSSDEEVDVNVDERRTRRGVYAILPKRVAKAMELDAETEADTASELTSLPPSRSSLARVPGSSKGNGLMTPDPEPSGPRQRDTVSASPHKAGATAPFKSVISTRAQKAKETMSPPPESISARPDVRQLVTPPLTTDTGSASTSVRSSSRLRTRDTDSLRSTPIKDKGKARATAIDSDDEPEKEPQRTLRPRLPSHSHVVDSADTNGKKIKDGPRGIDGKPLPTCATCNNVLPLISVDSEIVWGLALGRTGKRGRPRKNINVDCPRCMRHFAIFALKWPERVPSDGGTAFVPTPREIRSNTPLETSISRKVTSHGLPTLDRKLAAAASTRKRMRANDVDEEERVPKKPKTSTGRPRGRPPKNKVAMSAKARQLLNPNHGRRSGRARMPSLKLRESTPPKAAPVKADSPSSRPPVSSSSSLSPPESDDNPLEESFNAAPVSPSISSKLPTPKSLAVASQPRDSNGRFGKKATTNGRYGRLGRFVPKSGARSWQWRNREMKKAQAVESGLPAEKSQEAGTSTKVEEVAPEIPPAAPAAPENVHAVEVWLEDLNEVDTNAEEPSPKRPRLDEDIPDKEDEDEEAPEAEDEPESISHYTRPRLSFASSMKGGAGLLHTPNPGSFARRMWASSTRETPRSSPDRTPAVDDASSSTDDEANAPIAPVVLRTSPEPAPLEEPEPEPEPEPQLQDDDISDRPALNPFVGKLTLLKPSPFNLAKRRWAPPVATKLRNDIGSFSTDSNIGAESSISSRRISESRTDALEADLSSDEEVSSQSLSYNIMRPLASSGSPTNSESSVEGLLSGRPRTADGALAPYSSPLSSPLSLENSPGAAWKKTVLIPTTDIDYTFAKNMPTSPTKLVSAGWDTASESDS